MNSYGFYHVNMVGFCKPISIKIIIISRNLKLQYLVNMFIHRTEPVTSLYVAMPKLFFHQRNAGILILKEILMTSGSQCLL